MPVNPDDLLLVNRGGQDYKYPAEDFIGPTGETGADGKDGADGAEGPAGPGVKEGGIQGQILAKASGEDYETVWIDQQTTNELVLANTIIPELQTQADYNSYTDNRLTALEEGQAGVDARLPYILQTDKGGNPGTSGGEIQLFDADDNYSNVTFEGRNGITTSSTPAGIIVDGDTLSQATSLLNTTVNSQGLKIETLESKVSSLEGVVGEAEFVLNGANVIPRTGDFVLLLEDASTATTDWSAAVNVVFNDTDKNGHTFDFDGIAEGDVIRFYRKDDPTMEVSSVEYRVENLSGGYFKVVEVIKPVGSATDGSTYEMVHLSSFDPAGLATIDYVDAQDALRFPVSGGAMTGDINFEGGDHYIRAMGGNTLRFTGSDGSNSRTFIKFRNDKSDGTSGEDYAVNIYHLAEPESAQHAATKNYVDTSIANLSLTGNYVPLTGGTMTGNLSFKRGDTGFMAINSLRPTGYSGSGAFGLNVNLSDGNTFNHQLTITSRANRQALKLYDDGNPRWTLYGRVHLPKVSSHLTLEQSKRLDMVKDDGTNHFRVSPNSGDYYTNIYSFNGGGIRFRVADADRTDSYDTCITVNSTTHVVGSTTCNALTSVANLQMPTQVHHAANKQYVDDAVGDVDLDDYMRTDGAVCNGAYDFTTTGNGIRIKGDLKVKKTGQTISGSNVFEVSGDRAIYEGTTTDSKSIVNKQYIENNFTQGKFKITNSGGNYYVEPA